MLSTQTESDMIVEDVMPILDDRNFEFFSHSPDQTRRLGIHLGGYLRPGDVIALEGNLGSGKTTLVQGIAQGWGVLDPVSSPTYVIVMNTAGRMSSDSITWMLTG